MSKIDDAKVKTWISTCFVCNMGLTNMLMTLSGMVTCALCKNAGVLWPLMNADVMPRSKAKPPPKGLSRNEKLYKNPLYGQGCIPIGVILDINGWKNNLSSFPANIFSKPKHEHNLTFYEPWHLIREAKRLNETLYNSVLKAVVFAESVKQDADRVWEGSG